MTSSTFSCSTNSHTMLDSLIVVWDATELSFDCQTNVLRMSGTPRVSDLLPFIPKQRAPQFRPIIIVSIGARPFHPHSTNRCASHQGLAKKTPSQGLTPAVLRFATSVPFTPVKAEAP